MEISVNICLPEYIYRFYSDASRCVAESSPEKIMADALSAYAGILSDEIAKKRNAFLDEG